MIYKQYLCLYKIFRVFNSTWKEEWGKVCLLHISGNSSFLSRSFISAKLPLDVVLNLGVASTFPSINLREALCR